MKNTVQSRAMKLFNKYWTMSLNLQIKIEELTEIIKELKAANQELKKENKRLLRSK